MKTKLLSIIIGLLITSGFIKAQCTMTIAPTTVYGTPGTYTIGATGSSLYIQVCSNVLLYDTLGSNQRKYYLLPGAQLVLKGTFNQFVYMQGNSSVTRIGTTGSTNYVYKELTATVNGTFMTNTSTCTAVSFPTIACSGPTGITETEVTNLISVYPNPASNYFIINNSFNTPLSGLITNTLGKVERVCVIENGKNTIDLMELNEGIYFLTLIDKNKTVGYTKIIVSK